MNATSLNQGSDKTHLFFFAALLVTLVTGCETPGGNNLAAGIFNANAALSPDPRTAVLWGLLGGVAATEAQTQQQLQVAEAARSQVTINVPPQSSLGTAQPVTREPESDAITPKVTLFGSVLDEKPTERANLTSSSKSSGDIRWEFEPLEDPKWSQTDSTGNTIDADGFLVLTNSLGKTKRVQYKQISAGGRVLLLTIEKMVAQIETAKEDHVKRNLAEQVLEASTRFNVENLHYPRGWLRQAQAAMYLDRSIEGRMAAHWLLNLDAFESSDIRVIRLLSALEQRGWLLKKP